MCQPWQDHRDEIAQRLCIAPHRFVLSDFDGTLAPIVDSPSQASLSPSLRETLNALAGLPRIHVGVVSGRALDDIMRRVGLPKLIYAGNHGLEITGAGMDFVESTAASYRPELQSLARRLENELNKTEGVRLENKGLTLSIHYREVKPELQEQVRTIVQRNVAAHGDRFVDRSGLMVREVHPRAAWDKGAAVGWIKQRLRKLDAAVVFLGDDRTDEDVFTAFPGEITVKVGDSTSTAANYSIASSAEVPEFFEWLLRTVEAESHQPTV